MRVLVACEFSGIVRDAFAKLGHDAWSCDLIETEIPGNHIQGDVLDYLYDGWDIMIAHPPCTYLTVTGAQWFYHPDDKDLPTKKRRAHPNYPHRRKKQKEAVNFFMALINAPIERICVENPVGVMNTLYRSPDQIIQPYEFGHTEAKKTCLWLKHLPLLKPTKIMTPEYVTYSSGKRISKWFADSFSLPKEERSKIRSVTFQGIADAMAQQWGTDCKKEIQRLLFVGGKNV